ncbi:MAG: hypothetical protein ACREEV_07855 [Dongiaceae bacterium]
MPQIHSVGVEGGMAGLCPALDRLVAQRLTFDRCVFTTHGNKGMIFFADSHNYVDVERLGKLAGRGYERIFPTFSRIYFTGCNVAESDAGWAFLRKAGEIFLRLGGGYVFAHDTKGYSFSRPFFGLGPLGAGFLKGKFIHPPWDEVRGYIISPGGHVLQRVVD